MAIVYYPKSSIISRRDTTSASYEQVILSTYPNSILYFGSGSELNQISASTIDVTASYSIFSSTSSYALNAGGSGTSLGTGSTYPITSSWATNWNSSSLVSLINTKQNTLGTSSTYPITASWSTNTINWNSSSIVSLINTKQNTIATGSLIPVTASWAINWNSSSIVSLINTKQNTLGTSSTYPITSSWAISASWAPSVGGSGTSLGTGSTYPITSSWAENATLAQNVVGGALVESASHAITSDYAPVLFNNVRIINGTLLIKSEDTNNWFALTAYDDGSGSYTTQLTQSNATGSLLYTGSINCSTASYALTSSNLNPVNEIFIYGTSGSLFKLTIVEDPIGVGSINLQTI